MFLEELEEYQKLIEGQKKYKFPCICKNCGKVFGNRASTNHEPSKTCSNKCHRENLSKVKSGKRYLNSVLPFKSYFIKKSTHGIHQNSTVK